MNYLAWLNGIANPDYIVAGTTICVGATYCAPRHPRQHHGGFYYTVKSGDTLGNIGWKYGWAAPYFARVNGIPNPNLIYAGQALWIPAH